MQLTGLIREKGRRGTRNASSDIFNTSNTFSLESLTPFVVVVYGVLLLTF